jgi:transcriptional regulator with XRE-family HTH domain
MSAARRQVLTDQPLSDSESAGEKLGRQIRERRRAKEYTQQDLAKHCGVAKGQISKLEKSAAAGSARLLLRVARSLDTEVGLLHPDSVRVHEAGITSCFKGQDKIRDRIREDVTRAHEVRLLLARGWSVIGAPGSLLRDVLEQKSSDTLVRVLLLSPESDYAGHMESLAAIPRGEMIKKLVSTLGVISGIAARSRAKVLCRVYNEFPTWRLLFADDVVYAGSYLPKFFPDGSSITHFRVERKEVPFESLFVGFEAHFERLWQTATWPQERFLLSDS